MLGLAACGSGSSDSDEGGAPLSSVKIEGKQGEKPKVTFDGRLDDSEETEVLIEGDGETVADGDTVSTNWWVGNGFTQEEAQSTYGEGGNASIGIGNKDTVLAVVDILGKVDILDGPQGEEKKPAGWAPSLIEKDGVITGLDFTDAHKPSGELIATTLVKGDGPVVEKGQTLHVRYLGQVYGADKPFDENFSAEDPASFPIGVGGVVAGWDERLVGRTVGSRVILEIPPAKGYGKKGNPQAGIKGTDTLFFVVDILGVS